MKVTERQERWRDYRDPEQRRNGSTDRHNRHKTSEVRFTSETQAYMYSWLQRCTTLSTYNIVHPLRTPCLSRQHMAPIMREGEGQRGEESKDTRMSARTDEKV